MLTVSSSTFCYYLDIALIWSYSMLTFSKTGLAPSIRFEPLPQDEQKHCHSINRTIHSLSQYIDDFQMSLALFEHATENLHKTTLRRPLEDPARLSDIHLYFHWRKVAAQDCAMVTYHFCRARDGLKESLGASETMRSMIDDTLLKKAHNELEKKFPEYFYMRHGIAHSEDKHKTDMDSSKHTSIGDAVSNSLNRPIGITHSWGQIGLSTSSGSLSGGTLTDSILSTNWKRKIVSLDISTTTLENLRAVRDAYYDAFFSLEENSRTAWNKIRFTSHS